jgi:hypothetical protein
MLPSEEVIDPNAINIKQYLNTNNFSVNNRHFVIKASQETQLYNQKKYDLMAAINSLNRLICYKGWRKYQTCRMASSFNFLIKQN